MENRLRELREAAGMTQEDLAAKVAVSRQTIISLEKGKYNPSIVLAYELARVFSLAIEEVFIFRDEVNKDE
ncbi:MAG: helix-turn-helix transcriptional regulator [Chitinophagales bacterium]